MKIIGNEIISALIMSSIVTILVMLNVPKESYKSIENRKKPLTIALKTFILSFATTFAIFYFISDPIPTDVYKNVIQNEPDF